MARRAAPVLRANTGGCYLIETGAHPVLTPVAITTLAANGVSVVAHAASMRRDQPVGFFVAQRAALDVALAQRGKLPPRPHAAGDADAVTTRLSEVLRSSFELDVSADASLMTSGLGSSKMLRFVEATNAALDVHLPATVVFECGTVRAITARLVGLDLSPPPAPTRTVRPKHVALRCCVGHSPGAPHVVRLVPLSAAAADAIVEVPAIRWPSAETPEATRHSGFLAGAQRFDAPTFGISPVEAVVMDPQQRLLLELSYAALHGSHMRRESLMGLDIGLYVGLMNTDFATVASSDSVYAATGTQLSIASGRLAFTLGTEGPCASVDTACSSALVALNGTMLSLRAAACDAALAAAANLLLLPTVSLVLARAGMLSGDGRCKTFDARANGYVRAEGVGAVALEAQMSNHAIARSLNCE